MNPAHSDYSSRLPEDHVDRMGRIMLTGWLREGFFIATDSSDGKQCDANLLCYFRLDTQIFGQTLFFILLQR